MLANVGFETNSFRIRARRHKQEHSGDHISIKLAKETNPSMQNRQDSESPQHFQNYIKV